MTDCRPDLKYGLYKTKCAHESEIFRKSWGVFYALYFQLELPPLYQ